MSTLYIWFSFSFKLFSFVAKIKTFNVDLFNYAIGLYMCFVFTLLKKHMTLERKERAVEAVRAEYELKKNCYLQHHHGQVGRVKNILP